MTLMHRRDFLRLTALTSTAALLGIGRPNLKATIAERRSPWKVKPSSLDEITITEMQRRMANGRATAVSLTKQYLARIANIDRRGPALKAVIELNPDALAIAAGCDAQRKATRPCGPLHGIPLLIKDNIDTHDRMSTTAGSLALAGSVAPADAFLVKQLRRAGAVLLGKTNLSEWANFRGAHSTSGWSARGGQTRNPYTLDRNPEGSSSGSAVAVAANLCAGAVGTETDGSILAPASCNGIVGLKPTVGLISRSGIIPIAHSQDTAGPMARTVTDVAILLGVLAGADPTDPATGEAATRAQPDYTRFLDPAALRGARLGVARAFFGFHPKVDALIESSLAELKRHGAVLVEPITLKKSAELEEAELEVLRYEMKADTNAYLATRGATAPVHTLKEIIEFNERHRDAELPWFGQEELINSEAKGPLTEKAYLDAVATCRRLARTEGIDAAVAKDHLDAIVAPTNAPAPVTDWISGDHWLGGSTTPAAVAGYPSITVPAGFISDLPVGISFFGPAWTEPKLLALAFSFEQATRRRRAPRFLLSIEAGA
jgi:amidase